MGKEEKSRRRIVGQLAAQPAVGRECENIEACLSCDSRAIDVSVGKRNDVRVCIILYTRYVWTKLLEPVSLRLATDKR